MPCKVKKKRGEVVHLFFYFKGGIETDKFSTSQPVPGKEEDVRVVLFLRSGKREESLRGFPNPEKKGKGKQRRS